MSKDRDIHRIPETEVPIVITPPEVSELYKRLDEVEDQVEFVLGESSQSEGLKIGKHLGFIYGFGLGLIICILMKFVFNII